MHEEGWYAEHDVDLRLGRDGHRARPGRAGPVDLARTARAVGYDKLLLATGASPRRLTVPGADLDGVHYLRTVGDSERLAGRAPAAAARVVIVGAGWIGLEVAAAAREDGGEVTVVEPEPTAAAPRARRRAGRGLRRPAPRARRGLPVRGRRSASCAASERPASPR